MIKKAVKIILMLATIIIGINIGNINVSALSYGDFDYVTDGSIVCITKYYGEDEYVTVPNTIDGKKVTQISEGTFAYNNKIKNIKLNSNLKSLHIGAFKNCTSLTSITIGDNVNEIFTSNNKTSELSSCTSLKTVVIGNGIKIINENLFNGCTSITSIKLGKNVKEIEEYAFKDCINLKNILLNDKLELIRKGAFYNCRSLEQIKIPDSVSYLYSSGSLSHLSSTNTFGGCTNLKTVEIGDKLSKITEYTFNECTSLESVKLGKNVKEIEAHAFYNCKSLKNINLEKSLSNIGTKAFYGCENLQKVQLKVGSIGSYAFAHCTNLKKVSLNEYLTTISQGVFYNCDSLQSIVIPNNVEEIDYLAFAECNNLKNIVIGNRVKDIKQRTFYNCKSLSYITLGENIQNINDYAFENCYSLEEIYCMGNYPSISRNAFCITNSNIPFPDIVFKYKSGAAGFDNIAYKAEVFDPKIYKKVIFKSNGGEERDVVLTTFNGLQISQPPVPTRNGCTFVGWYTNPNGVGNPWNFIDDNVEQDITLYAKWSYNKYILEFNGRWMDINPEYKIVTYNSSVGTLPNPITEGYVFDGWYTEIDGRGKKYTSSSKMTPNDLMLYANWVRKLNSPTNIKSNSDSYNSIKISWNKIDDAHKYEIYTSSSKTGKYTKIATTKSTSYRNIKLKTGRTYYYKVRACKVVNGKSFYSDYSSVTSSKPLLSKPSVTLSTSYNKAYVKWKKISGASGYEIYRATSKNGSYQSVKNITSGSTTSYTNSKLKRKKLYYYKVRAYRIEDKNKVYSPYSSIKYIRVK